MRRARVLTALLAVVLAVAGTVLLSQYVRGADARAMAGTAATEVLVVTESVPSGTTAEDLAERVETKSVPLSAVVPGALTTLGDAGGRVTAVDLQVGEQVLASRLVAPAAPEEPEEVPVPAGLQQLSVALERQRMLGDDLAPGDTVGVLVSLDEAGVDAPAQTKLTVQQVLVLRVGEESTSAVTEDEPSTTVATSSGAATPPPLTVLVTLAVDAADAQRIVFGAEHGRLWLTHQPVDAGADDSTNELPVMTRKDLYR